MNDNELSPKQKALIRKLNHRPSVLSQDWWILALIGLTVAAIVWLAVKA